MPWFKGPVYARMVEPDLRRRSERKRRKDENTRAAKSASMKIKQRRAAGDALNIHGDAAGD